MGHKTSLLKAGDTIFLPRNIPHTWKVLGNYNAKVFLSVFPSGIKNMFEELKRLPYEPPNMELVIEITERYGNSFCLINKPKTLQNFVNQAIY